MATKEEKPTLAGVNIKTRKRNIAVALDPASFADAVVSIFADARTDGDAEGEAWLAAGLPALQTADLDFSRYGDTLFEVLFAGGRMSAGGAVVDDGRPTLDRAYLAPGVPEDSIGAFVAAFQALLRRRPFLVKNLENTLAKLVKSLECYDDSARSKIATAAARVFAARLGPQADEVLAGLINDRNVQKGMTLAWATAFFQAFLKAGQPGDELLALLRRAKLDDRLADLFPSSRAAPADVAAHFAEAGLTPLVEYQARIVADAAAADLRSAVDEMVGADPPHDAADVLRVVEARQAETGLADADVVRVLWSAIVAAAPTHGRNTAQVLSAVARGVRAYKPVLARYAATARGEGALLVHVQVSCYENPKLLKLFAPLIRLLYTEALVNEDGVRWWARKGAHPKGRHVFQNDLEPFIKWLDEAEEEA